METKHKGTINMIEITKTKMILADDKPEKEQKTLSSKIDFKELALKLLLALNKKE